VAIVRFGLVWLRPSKMVNSPEGGESAEAPTGKQKKIHWTRGGDEGRQARIRLLVSADDVTPG
jgi:hypothetical protein